MQLLSRLFRRADSPVQRPALQDYDMIERPPVIGLHRPAPARRAYSFSIPRGQGTMRMVHGGQGTGATALKEAQDAFGAAMLSERRERGQAIHDNWKAIHGLGRNDRVIYRCPGPEHLKAMSPEERARFGG